MIGNIIDKRERKYRWLKITAIMEPTWQDNSVDDSDQASKNPMEGIGYEEFPEISLRDALIKAAALPYLVTVYIYDLGQGINDAEISNETNSDTI